MFDMRNNRFFGMINGFLAIISRRKPVFLGKPSKDIYYDDIKKRYIVAGEEDSDEDVPPPPPPKKMVVTSI
jgi:hypothetical protein